MTDINWQSLQTTIAPDEKWKRRAKAELVVFAKRTSNQKEVAYSGVFMLRPKFAAVLTALLILVLIPRTIVASQSSRPGQFLYPFKRLTENAQLVLLTGDKKTSVQVAQTVERTHELSTSVEKDSQDLQMKAVLEVEATKNELEKLPDEIKKETYKKVKERLENIKKKVKHDRVKMRLDAIIEALGMYDYDKRDEGALTPTQTPSVAKKSPSSTPTPTKTTSTSASSHSEVKVETNNGYTQVIINGEVVVTHAPTQTDTKIEVKLNGGSVHVQSSSNVKSKSTIDVDSDD